MQIYVPDVYASLQAKEIPCEIFSIQWYLTLFSYDFGPNVLARIWDMFLLMGWKFIFQLSIVILRNMAHKIETMKYNQLLTYLKSALVKDEILTVQLSFIIE